MASSVGDMMSGLINDASQAAVSQFQFGASQIAGVSGMVAEQGTRARVHGVPSGLFGNMAGSFSRSVTPYQENMPPRAS